MLNKIISEKNRLYGLDHTFPDGSVAYYFILVEPYKERSFVRTLEKRNGMIDLEKYGDVIECGYGKPPAFLIDDLKKRYDFVMH